MTIDGGPKPWSNRPSNELVTGYQNRAQSIDEGSAGLPIGVQVAGVPYREDVVLAVMHAIERGARTRDGYPATPVDPS